VGQNETNGLHTLLSTCFHAGFFFGFFFDPEDGSDVFFCNIG
jgi:hypothetical protein